MKNALKELVKKHFNLVEASPEVVEDVKVEEQLSEEVAEATTEEVVEETLSEETTEETFGEIKTADGELTLKYDGDELAEAIAIFVDTEDGDIPAPDGTHDLEGGITISTEGGVITSIVDAEVEAESEEEMSEETELSEETKSDISELHEAIIQMIGGEFKEQFTALKEELMGEINTVKEAFNAAPATEKTITNNKKSYGRNNSVDLSYNPKDNFKAAQFERLLKNRKTNKKEN